MSPSEVGRRLHKYVLIDPSVVVVVKRAYKTNGNSFILLSWDCSLGLLSWIALLASSPALLSWIALWIALEIALQLAFLDALEIALEIAPEIASYYIYSTVWGLALGS